MIELRCSTERIEYQFEYVRLKYSTKELADFKGKTVLLDFWAMRCVPCREDGPALDKLQDKYGEKNVAIVGIVIDADDNLAAATEGEKGLWRA